MHLSFYLLNMCKSITNKLKNVRLRCCYIFTFPYFSPCTNDRQLEFISLLFSPLPSFSLALPLFLCDLVQYLLSFATIFMLSCTSALCSFFTSQLHKRFFMFVLGFFFWKYRYWHLALCLASAVQCCFTKWFFASAAFSPAFFLSFIFV